MFFLIALFFVMPIFGSDWVMYSGRRVPPHLVITVEQRVDYVVGYQKMGFCEQPIFQKRVEIARYIKINGLVILIDKRLVE